MNVSVRKSAVPGTPRLAWLAAGAALGLLASAYGMLERSTGAAPLPEDAVARVNDRLIESDRYRRAVEDLATVIGRDPDAGERRRALQQLVEEELLVQRGVALGMAESEATVRSAIVQSLIASITAEADAADPSDAELERHLEEHADDYTYASALELDAWITDDEWHAQNFVNRLRNEPRFDGAGNDDVRRVPGLPDGPLPIERLRMFVGPAIAAAARDMPPGSSAVYARQGRWYVVRVKRHETSAVAQLDAVRTQVLIDYRRRLAEARLREYLDKLFREADVSLSMPR